MKSKPKLTLICPCYNEEDVIDIFIFKLIDIIEDIKLSYEIIIVNDGSKDNTLEKVKELKETFPCIKILNLSRNFGKEAALTAGLDKALGKAIIPIDVDFQDPPELIPKLILKWQEGYDIVLAKRIDRSNDQILKSLSAKYFYKVHNQISDVIIPENVGDFRLISRKVLKSLKKLPENQRFMKGIFAWVGYKTATVEYKREKRKAGNGNFNGWKLWNFAIDGITSFSTLPLRIWLYIGVFISVLSFIYGTIIVIKTLFFEIDVPGYASILTSILFLGGIQLVGIGVLGEYIGRIYLESKKRPTYIIESEY